MNRAHASWRRPAIASLLLVGLILQFVGYTPAALAVSSNPSTSPPGHRYTVAELQGYTKEQLVGLVMALQDRPVVHTSVDADQSPETQTQHFSALGLIERSLAAWGSRCWRAAFNPAQTRRRRRKATTPLPQWQRGLLLTEQAQAYHHFSLASTRMPGSVMQTPTSIHPLSNASSSCTSNSQLFCNVNVTQDTCTSLQVAQGAFGSAMTIAAGQTSASQTNIDPNSAGVIKPGAGSPSAQGTGSPSPTFSALAAAGEQNPQAALNSLGAPAGVVKLEANPNGTPKVPTVTSGSATNLTYLGAGGNLLFSLANIWVGCNNQVTTTTSPAPSPTSSSLPVARHPIH